MIPEPTPPPLGIAITYPFALGTRSGGSTSVFETARELARLGQEVVVLPVSTVGWSRSPRPRLGPELRGDERRRALEAEGVEVVPVEPHRQTQWLDARQVARAVGALARRRRLDVILGFHHEAALLPRLAARLGSRFCMITIWQSYRAALGRGFAAAPRVGAVTRLLNRRAVAWPLRRAERLFATSRFTRDELVDVVGLDAARIDVCYQGVDPLFAGIPRRAPAAIERLLFFGRLTPGKGLGDALRALAGLAAGGGSDWTLRVMGEGPHEPYTRLARELGIAGRVELLPFQGPDGLRRELEAAHLALLPSHSESFGLSIAEAQAAGLPVVAYDCGSVPEIVEPGVSGWLAPFGDTDALRRCLELALERPDLAHAAGLAGRERIAGRFTWAGTARRILDGLRRPA
jgi:D-inositol-3-phosphate glycosyltransferase